MRSNLMAWLGVVGLTFGFGLSVARAQEHPAGHDHQSKVPAAPAAPAVAASTESSEIFCPTMKTGQLCSHGTADALSLEGVKREAWIAAARRYNRAVDEATKHLLSDAESLLTPEEKAEVESWFAKGLNPQINQLLEAAAKPRQ
jgi:hypothetical protein